MTSVGEAPKSLWQIDFWPTQPNTSHQKNYTMENITDPGPETGQRERKNKKKRKRIKIKEEERGRQRKREDDI